MRRITLLLLVLLGLAPALAAPPTGAAGVVSEIREKAGKIKRFEADVLVTRADLRFLEAFFAPGPSGPPLQVRGPMAWTSKDGFDLYLGPGGARYHRFQSRQGASLRYSGLFRLGPGSNMLGPLPTESPSFDEGFEDFGPDSVTPRLSHPLIFLWPFELRPALPGEEYLPEVARENLFGREAWRLSMTASGGLAQTLWVDRQKLRLLRVEAQLPGDGPPLQADYRYDEAPEPAWGELEVSVGHRPIYVARMTDPRVNPPSSRVPETLLLRRPGGEKAADRGPRLSWSTLPAWQQSAFGTLGLILAYLGLRFLWFQLRRQVYSREIILVDRPDGPWKPRLERLGFPVEVFDPMVLTRELRTLGRRATADSGRPPRMVLVAANGCANISKHVYLLRSYVEAGGRVLMMEHSPSSARYLPFRAEMMNLPEAAVGTVFSDPDGPWSRTNFEEVGHFAAAMGSGHYYVDVEGRPVDWEIMVLAGPSGEPRGVALGVARRGRGEWILSQVALPVSSVGRKTVGERFLRDLLDYVQGRRLWFPELEDEPEPF